MTSCHYSSSFASHDLFCLITWPLILSPPLPFFVSVYSYSLFFSCLSPLHVLSLSLSLISTFAFLTFDLFIHYDTCLYLPNFETRFIDRLFVLIYYQSVFQVPFLAVKSEFRAIFSRFFSNFSIFRKKSKKRRALCHRFRTGRTWWICHFPDAAFCASTTRESPPLSRYFSFRLRFFDCSRRNICLWKTNLLYLDEASF